VTGWRGRIAIVTGAASGTGRACAERILELGGSVVAVDLTPAHWLSARADVRLRRWDSMGLTKSMTTGYASKPDRLTVLSFDRPAPLELQIRTT
jgi:NAD(P)-dependent dehydrogenase (short-subunit alcohol dehydrogenase family)